MIRRSGVWLFFLALLLCAVHGAGALAQSLPGAPEEQAAEQEGEEQPAEEEQPPAEPTVGTSVDAMADPMTASERAQAWRRQLEQISQRLQTEELDEADLISLRDRVQAIAADARTLQGRLEPQLQAVRARLDQLGPPPGDGQPHEPPELRERRQSEENELSRTDTALKTVRLVAVEGEQLALDISATRRDRMNSRITARGPSALDPGLWREVISDGATGARELARVLAGSWSLAGGSWAPAPFVALGGVLALVLIGRGLLRAAALRFGLQIHEEVEEPSVSRKLLCAVFITLSIGVLPSLLLFGLFVVLDLYGVLAEAVASIVRGLFVAMGTAIFVFAFARAFFAPSTPRWRVLDLSDGVAKSLSFHVTAVGVVLGGSALMQVLNNVLVGAVSLDNARRIVTAFLIALFFALSLRRLGAEWQDEDGADAEKEPGPFSVLLRMVVWAALAIILGALVLGYTSLAVFLSLQLVFGVLVFSILWLLLGLTDDLVTTFVRPGMPVGHALQAGFGLSSNGVKQVAVLGSGLVRLALIVFSIMLILLPWGFEADRWTGWLRAAFFGFQVGEVSISIASILTAILLLVLGIAATRGIQGWLANRYLPNTRLDVGMRNSIRTMSGYVGVITAAVFAFGYLGLNLENVALLAGALSVGIGFGLQSIVNNFVSGLILLAERPIKEGDWIVVGAEQGYVRKISIRSTEIETFDRGTVIVPNSDLITGTVKNWTHSSMIGRVDVWVSVAYGTSTQKVHDLVLEVARENASILYYPEPAVLFMDFGEHALKFRLFAFIADINNVYTVASELRFEIEKRFAEEDIVIPLPQQDVRFRDMDRLEAALMQRAGGTDGGRGSAGEDGAT